MRYVYLHGFASSPASRKALAFVEAFAAKNIILEVPDLAANDFEHLTISSQLAVIERLLQSPDPGSVRLIGSSMGGYLAALYAEKHPRHVDRLVLLAPAFDFPRRWREMTGPEALAEWQSSGWLSVYHYGDKTQRRLHYGLVDDALRYPAFPDFTQAALIFHGTSDPTVPVELSRAFTVSRANASLIEMSSGHELTDVLEEIIAQALPFLFP